MLRTSYPKGSPRIAVGEVSLSEQTHGSYIAAPYREAVAPSLGHLLVRGIVIKPFFVVLVDR